MSDEEKQNYRFGSLTFAEKVCMPLQAADILAYEVNKETARQRNINNTRLTRKSILNLAVSRIDEWFYMDKKGFLDVINFIKEKGLNEGIIEL